MPDPNTSAPDNTNAATLLNQPAATPDAAAAAAAAAAVKPGEAKPGEAKPGEVKPGEAKPGEAKPGEKPGEKPAGAPEKYEDFKLPEDVTLAPEAKEEFTKVAKELNLTQEGAQKLMDLAAKHTQGVVQGFATRMTETRTEWVKTIKADPEYGGAKLTETIELGKRALKEFGDPEVNVLMETFGIGDNPSFIRMMAKIGRAMSEDKFIDGKSSGVDTRSAAEVVYGKQ